MKKLFKILTIISGVLAVILSIFSKGDVRWTSLLYFTQQSNLWAAIMALILLLWKNPPKYIEKIRFMVVAAIALTVIVFNALLTPQMILEGQYSYLFSFENVFAHYLTGIFFIIDYLLYGEKNTIKSIFYTLILPLLYFVFAMTANPLFNIMFYKSPVPYFFLDYKEYSFFKIGYAKTVEHGLKLGVFYWIIINIIIILLIGSLLYLIKGKVDEKRTSQQIDNKKE